MSENLFQAVMAEASISDKDDVYYANNLVFDDPTSDLLQTAPLSLVYNIVADVWDAGINKRNAYKFKPTDYAEWTTIKALSAQEKADLIGLVGLRFISKYFHLSHDRMEHGVDLGRLVVAEKTIMTALLRSNLPFTELHILALIQSCRNVHDIDWGAPLAPVMKAIDVYLAENTLSAVLQDALRAFRAQCEEEAGRMSSKTLRQATEQLDLMLAEHAA